MNKILIAMGSTLLLSAAMLAQDSSGGSTPATTSTPAHKPTINQRKHYQQRRIRQGVRSGELTKGETKKLEKQEHALNQEERDMRKVNNGHLTKQDRKTLHQQQNHLSKEIYKDKHNNRKRPGAGGK